MLLNRMIRKCASSPNIQTKIYEISNEIESLQLKPLLIFVIFEGIMLSLADPGPALTSPNWFITIHALILFALFNIIIGLTPGQTQ